MKSKKLISFLCAAAMTVSSFAGLAVTASAASEPVWSWDGSSVITDAPNAEVGIDANGKFMQITAENNTKTYSYDLPAAAQLSNDYVIEFDTAIHAGNGMGRLAQYTQIAFASAALGTTNQDKKTYGGDYAAAATAAMKDADKTGLNMAQSGTFGSFNSATDAGAGYQSDVALSLTSRIELLNNWIVNYDGSTEPSIEDGDAQTDAETWYRVRAAVKNGKANITIMDAAGKKVYEDEKNATTSKITKLAVTTSRGDANFFSEKLPASGPARVLLSNIKVYSGVDSAPAMTTEGLRGEAKPITWGSPEEVAGAAPRLAAPSGTTGADNINFESDSTDTKIVIGDAKASPAPVTEATVGGGKVKLTTGTRDAGEAASYASIVNVTGGSKAVKLNGDRFATGGRSPMLHMVDGALSTTGTTVLGFSAYISKNVTSGSPKLWLIDADSSGALTNSGKTGLNHTGLFGVLQTTAPTDATKYSSSYQRAIQITPDEWHTVVVTMDAPGDNAKYRIFVDGQYMNGGSVEAAVTAPSVHYGGTAYYPDKLPVIAVENDKETSSYSTVLIDNIVKYTIDGVEEENLPTSYVPEAKVTIGDYADATKSVELTLTNTDDFVEENIAEATVTLIHAAYDNGKLKSVKAYENAKIDVASGKGTVTFDADDTVSKGDKLMVWDSLKGMKPLGAVKEVTTGQAPTPTTAKVKYTGDNVASVTVGQTVIAAGDTGTDVTIADNQDVTIVAADNYKITAVTGLTGDPTGLNTKTVTGKIDVKAAGATIGITTAADTTPAAKATVKLAAATTDATVKLNTNDTVDAATGVQVDKNTAVPITVTPADGKKLTAVTVEGGTLGAAFNATSDAEGYTSTLTATADAVTVTVTTADKEDTPPTPTTAKVKYTGDNVASVTVGQTVIAAGDTGTDVTIADNQDVTIVAADNYKITAVTGLTGDPTGLNTKTVTGKIDVKAAGATIGITTEADPPAPTTGTVTVTGANVKSVTLTPKSTGEAIKIDSTDFTSKEVPAGTYTVTAEAADNYYIEKIDPADVTVTAGESASITVTAQKSPVFGTAADADATDSAVVTLSTKTTDFGSVTTRADLTGFGVYKVEEGKITGSSNNTTLQPTTGTKGHWIPIAVKVPAANAATAKIKIYCPIPTGDSYTGINPADENNWTKLTENKPATNGVYGAIICMEKKGDGTSDLQQAPVYPRKKAWVRVALDGTNYSDPVEIDWTGVDLLGDPAAESSPSDDTSIKGSGASNVVGDTDNLNDGAKVQDLGSVSVTKTAAPQDAQQDGYIYYTADGNTKAAGTDSANYAAVTLVPPSTEAKGVAIKALTEAKNANTANFSDDDVKKIDSTKDVTAVLKLDGENKAYQIAFVTGNGVALASLSPESYQTIGDTMVIDFSKVNTQGANDPGTPTDAKGTINGTDGTNEENVFPNGGLKYETETESGFVKKITVSGKYAKLYEANGRKGVCVGVVFTRSADDEKITHSYVSSTPLKTAPTPDNLGDGLQWSDHSVSDAQQQVYGYWPDMTSVSNGNKYIYLVVEKTGGTKKVFAYHVVLDVTQMDSTPTNVQSMADKVDPDANLGSFNADDGSSKASDYGTFDVDKATDGEARFSGTANKIKVTAKNMEGYYVPVKLTIPEINKSKASVKWVVKTDGNAPSDDDYKPYTPTTDITDTGRLDIMTKVYDKDGTKVNKVIYFKVDLDGPDEFAYSETAYKFTFDNVTMAKAPATEIINTGEPAEGKILIGLVADEEKFGTDKVDAKEYGKYTLSATDGGATITGTAYNHTFNGTPGLSYKDWYLPITFKGVEGATLKIKSVTYNPSYSGNKKYPSGDNILPAEQKNEFTFALCLRPVDTLYKGEAGVEKKTETIQSITFTADADGAGNDYSEVEYTLDLSKIALTYGVTTTFTQDQEETNHGYITIDNPHVKAGEQASVTVKAAEGYKIKSVTTSDPATTPTPSDSTTYTFEMPAQNVSVSATFEPAEEPYTHYTSTSGKVTAVSLYNGGTENDAAAKTYAQLIADGVTTKKVGEGSGNNNNKPGVKFEKDILLANQFNESGSDITAESTDDASITVLKVDATGVDKTSNRLELCLDVESAHTAGTSGNTDVILRQVADIDDLDALTFTSLTKSKGTTTNLGNVKPGNPIKVALDITSALKAEDDNTISYLITAKSPREIKIISPELKVTPVYALTKSSSMTEGDVKFKVKDAEVTAAAESEEVTLDITVPDGKEITEVSYTPNGDSKQVITDTDGVYKFTMPAKAVEVNVTFAEKKGTPVTSLTLVYSTTNDAEQTINQDKKVEDEGLLTNKMVEETVEIPSKYKAPILVPSGLDDGQYDVYVYDDTCLDSEITLNAAEATQVVKVKQLDGKHYYYENFDALPKATADGDKTDAATDTFFKLTNSNKDRTSARVYNNLTINGVNLKQALGVKGDNNNANTTMQISSDGIGGTGKNVSVSFKASLGAGNNNCKGTPHLSIRDTSQKALFTTSDSTSGYFGGLTINDTTLSKYAAGSAENGFSTVTKGAGGWNNYDVTYVWDVNVDVDFTNKAAHMVITEEGTSRTLYEDYYTTDISNIADLYFDLANIGAVIVDDIDIKPFADSIEKMYTATVTAVPGATVTISGQSTSGKSISKSGVAGGDGKAAVKDVLAGTSYTINATAPNKYRKAATPLESQEVGEGKTEFSISIPYDTEQYNNLIYGDDFESLAADTAVIGGTQSGAMITNGDPFDIWKFTAGTNNYDKFIIRADNGPEDPNTVSKKAHDGQFAYAVSYSGDSSYVGTALEDISSIEFDTCLDGVAGSKSGTGFMDTLFKFGDTMLFTMTANPESSTASLDTIGIVVGEQKLVSSAGDHPWVHVKITDLNTESATVEITKYSDGTTLSVVPDDKITGTVSIADVGAKTGFSIVGAKTNGIGTKQHSGMALDNFEVYSAGE